MWSSISGVFISFHRMWLSDYENIIYNITNIIYIYLLYKSHIVLIKSDDIIYKIYQFEKITKEKERIELQISIVNFF